MPLPHGVVRETTAVVTRLLAVVVLARLVLPAPGTAYGDVLLAGGQADPLGPLLGAVALVAWALVGWLALTALLLLAGRVPGALGRGAALLAGRMAPLALRRALGVAVGAGLVLGTVTPAHAHGATGTPSLLPPPAAAADTTTGTSLDWPATAPPAAPTAAPPAGNAAGNAAAAPAASVVVRPGDSLWAVAERSLTGRTAPTAAAVAATWPAWWAANREAVGDDPHLLRPGTALVPPAPSRPSTSETS